MSVTCEHVHTHRPKVSRIITNIPRNVVVPRHMTIAGYVLTFLLAALAIQLLMNHVIAWGKVMLDDLQYGRPRTMHITGIVGHDDANGEPTHFIAMNLRRQVVVMEMPGGDPTKTRSFYGPYLFGENEELTPVVIQLRDVDRDSHPDIILNVRNEQIVYLNKDGAFRLPNNEEQAVLKKSS